MRTAMLTVDGLRAGYKEMLINDMALNRSVSAGHLTPEHRARFLELQIQNGEERRPRSG